MANATLTPTTCGHAATPSFYAPGSTVTLQGADGVWGTRDMTGQPFTSGTAHTSDGRVLCYTCAEAEELAAFHEAATYGAYLSSDGRTVTTWTGATLAQVTSNTDADNGWHGSTITHIRAVDSTGAHWFGKGGGEGMCLTMRRNKVAAPHAERA